jgi:outer membrane protein assembly complex protein YaeT
LWKEVFEFDTVEALIMTKTQGEKRTKKRKLKKRIFFVISAFFLAVLIGGLIFLHTGAFESFLLEKASHYFESQFNLALDVESLDLSPLRLSAVLNGVDVQSIPGTNAFIQNLSARKFLIDLGFATLFGRRIHIQKINIIGPQLELTQHKLQAGTEQSESAATKKPMSLRIDEFMMADGSLNIDSKEISANARVADIEINGSYHKDKGLHSGSIKSGRGEIEFEKSQILLHELHTEFEFDEKTLEIKQLSVRTDPLSLSASGEAKDFLQSPQFNFEINGSLQLDRVKDIVPFEHSLSGLLSFSAFFKGSGKDISLQGDLLGTDTNVADIPFHKAKASFQADAKHIEVENLELIAEKGELRGKIDLDLTKTRESKAELEWKSIHLAAFEQLEPRFLPFISTVSDGSLLVAWEKLALDSIRAGGEVRFESLKNPRFDGGERYSLSGNIGFEASDGHLKLMPSTLRLSQTEISFGGSIDDTKRFSADFSVVANDLSQIERLYKRFVVEVMPESDQLAVPMPSAGRLTLSGKAHGTITDPELSIHLNGQDIALKEVQIIRAEGQFHSDRRGISVSDFHLDLQEGFIQSKGHLSYNFDDHSFGDTSSFTAAVEGVDLSRFSSSFEIGHALTGILSATVNFTGSPKNPKIKFSISGKEITFDSEAVSLAELGGQLLNQRLLLDRILIRKGDGFLEGNLGYDLESQKFQADLTGREIDLADFKTVIPQDTALNGIAHLQFKGNGTLENPVFNLKATAEKIRVGSAYLDKLGVVANSDGQTVTLQAKIPAGQTVLDAHLFLKEPLSVEGQIKTKALDVWNILSSRVEPLPSPVSSEITALATFNIPLGDWKQSTGRVSFEKLGFSYINLSFQNHQPFGINVNPQEISFEPVQIIGPETELTISGKLPFSDGDTSQIALKGAVNLRLLEAFLPSTEIGGILSLSGDISGTVTDPVVNARIELQDSVLNTSAIPYTLHDMSLAAGIRNNVLDLEGFSVGVDDGLISASGKIFLPFRSKEDSLLEAGRSKRKQDEITISLSGLDLGRLVDILPEKPSADLGGALEGSIRLRGDLLSAGRIEIEGELTRLEFLLSKFRMANDQEIRFRLEENIFRMDDFKLSGGDSFIQADLSLALGESPQLDGRLAANLNTSILTPLFEGIILDGNLGLDLEYKGPLNDIGLNGKGRITNGLFQLQDIPFLAAEVEGGLRFAYGEPATFEISGMFNGGKTTAKGTIDFMANTVKSAELNMTAEQVQLSYPEGFQGLIGGYLNFVKREQRWDLSGDLELNQSYYNEDIYPGSEILRSLRSRQRALKSDIPPSIRNLGLEIGLVTVSPFIVDNNMASIELEGNILLTGTVFEPRLSGFVRNRQPGEIIFGNRDYEVEQLSINYADADPLDGQINVIAHTRVKDLGEELNVTLTASGSITNLDFSLSSDALAERSQMELVSLLLMDSGTSHIKNEAANVLGNQLMLYFLSPLTTPFTDSIKDFLGAEDVSLEPINIATEEDPGARFTFRKGLVPMFDLIYSIDISNTQRQTWILDYSLSRNFGFQSFAKDDGSYGGSVRHRFFLGSPSRTETFARSLGNKDYKIQDVVISGNVKFSQETLTHIARDLKTGSVFHYKDLRSAIEKLMKHYKDSDYLNAVISSSLAYHEDDSVSVNLQISAKDQAQIVFVGDPIKNSIKKHVIDKWNGRLPEEMSMLEAEKRVRLDLNSQGYIEAEVTASKTEEKNESFYVVYVHLGPKYRIGQFTVAGESAISPKSIKKAVSGIPRSKGKGLWALLYDFKRSKLRIVSLHEELGYQNVVIDYPEMSLDRDTKTVNIALPIQKGIQSRIHSVSITGNENFAASEIEAILRMKESDIFSPNNLATDTNLLYSFYRARGYHDVGVDVQIQAEQDLSQIGIVYTIREGDIHLISAIDIFGNDRTPDHIIRRELAFREGDPLNMEQIIASQKNLYDLLVFRTVNIRPESFARQAGSVRVVVEVQEDPRLGVSYGLRYNSEEKFEAFGQLNLINLFGRGRSGLIFYKQNDRQKDFRFSLKDPYIFSEKLNTLYSISYLDETLAGFKSKEFGFTVQQTLPLPFESTLSYLFRLNRIHTYELDPIGPFPFDFKLFLPEIQVFWIRDTRLNRINAKQGSFLSISSKYSPTFLKTDLNYISFFGQYSLYLRVLPFLVWASNYRIGLADAFEQILIPGRRFFAGGANSIRGFERDMVGPYDPYLERPIGGKAVFVVNQELRFPLFKWFEGVAFFDAGNVYRYINEFNPLDIRTAVGFGLRLNIPALFLRFDYGINLSPREFEPRGVFYISFGQAF